MATVRGDSAPPSDNASDESSKYAQQSNSETLETVWSPTFTQSAHGLGSDLPTPSPAFSSSTVPPVYPSPAPSCVSPPSQVSIQGIVPQIAMASSLGKFVLYLVQAIPRVLYWVITFTTITVPTWLFTLFSMSLTFTMNFTTLLIIVLVLVSTISWFIRYRFLNMYSRLPHEPQRKEPQIDLFPDTQEGDSKPGLANYLDEFLSAIKVFGYLERPVFHELTRTMQTRKLIAGETLLLEEEKGFCLVVDGLVQIFVKSIQERHNNDANDLPTEDVVIDSTDEDDDHHTAHQGYQLLTEVKNGASMSSLFSILSLFSEDVNLRHTDDVPSSSSSAGGEDIRARESNPTSPTGFSENPIRPNFPSRDTAVPINGEKLPAIPPLALEGSGETRKTNRSRNQSRHGSSKPRKPKSIHPDILARAMVDTTIAIIPASAFRRLTRLYPKATAHIIQVILTRLQRVTFATAHSYLGLTTEVLSIEKQMHKYTAFDLPNHLRGMALDRLKDKFSKEKERLGPEDGTKGIALHNPALNRRKRSSSSVRKGTALHAKITAAHGRAVATNGLRSSDYETTGVSPGDLLSTIQLSRYGPRYGSERLKGRSVFYDAVTGMKSPVEEPTTPSALGESPLFRSPAQNISFQKPESIDEEALFRESILDCMMKALGLTESTSDALRKSHTPGDASPQLVSYDTRRQKAVFNNAFGFIDPYESFGDGDSESVMSMSVTSAGGTSPITNLRADLGDEIEIVFFPKGSVLVEEGERNPGIYYVIDGFLDVGVPVNEKGEDLIGNSRGQSAEEVLLPMARAAPSSSRTSSSIKPPLGQRKKASRRSLYMVKPGGIEGYTGSITSYRSFTDVTAKTDVYVGFLPRGVLERIADKYPLVMLTMAKRITTVLPRLILHIDFALEWVQVNAGQVIYHRNDESDAIYIVLNGRLRSVLDKGNGNVRVLGEYGQGDSVGELEVMTESTRPGTLHAIRDTELAKFPRTLFNSLAQEHPGITIQISKLIAQRMRHMIDNPLEEGRGASLDSAKTNTSTMNLRTVAILPVTTGIPVVEFGNRLLNAFSQIGVTNGVTSLHQADILNHLGRHAFSKMGKLKLSQYLADLEERYGMVLYVADTNVNAPWTQTCITQADCILLVAVAEGSPAIGEYERFLLGMKTTARKELVLLHLERYSPPGLTRHWLKNRMWINGGHHHVQMAFRLTTEPAHPRAKRFGTVLKQRVQVIQAEIQKYTSRRIQQTPLYSASTPFKGDFHRLARRLCGKSVGLVLGGGGARGIAHVGVIKALEEAGVPVDIVGGTSIGAFIGALYARDADLVPVYGRAKKFSGRMASMWRFALDLTYPSASYTTGHEFNRGIFKAFGNSHIEDFWLEFYCNTTNISKSRPEIHSSGYAWRYVRASMTLAGLIPPLCDEGNMLLDGGYVDNLTVPRMRSLGADVIFAVDVGSIDDNTPQGYGDSLSGFWALVNRWNPFSSLPNPPTLSEIQARLAYVSSFDALERAKNTPGCLYMRPPIDPFGTLDFAKYDEIYQVGYQFGREFLERLKSEGALPVQEETEEKKKLRRTMAPRRASI